MSNKLSVVEASKSSLIEYHSLRDTCGLLGLGERGRLCLTGVDRISFLHGQITQISNLFALGMVLSLPLLMQKERFNQISMSIT